MILSKPLEAEFWQEFKQFEQERSMSYITTGEGIGYERGKEDDRHEGRQQQAQALILRLLQKRLGDLPQEVKAQLQSLSLEQWEALGEALLDFRGISQGETADPNADLLNWLQAQDL